MAKNAVRVSVARRGNDTNQKLIKRFCRKVQNSGILDEARERMYFTGTRRAKKRRKARRK